MTYQQPHDEWEEKIVARLAGDLDPIEFVALDDHLRSCPQCAQIMKEYELLSNSILLIEDDEPERQPPPAIVELKKEIAQRRILEESLRIVEEAFNVCDGQQEVSPNYLEEVVTETPESDDQRLVLAYSGNRSGRELPMPTPSFPGPGIFIQLECENRFFEVLPDEVENAELTVEDVVSHVLLDLFGEGTVDDVSIHFSPYSGRGLQHCSIRIRAQCSHQNFMLLPRTKENIEHAVEKSICSLLKELFGTMHVETTSYHSLRPWALSTG